MRRSVFLFIVLSLVAPAAARAAGTVRAERGTLRLTLREGLQRDARAVGIEVTRAGAGSTVGRTFVFPVSGGRIDPATLSGTSRLAGRIILSARARRLVFTNLKAVGGTRPRVTAAVGGRRLTVFRFESTAAARLRRRGFTTVVTGLEAQLARPAARRISRAFGIAAPPGVAFGTVNYEVRGSAALVTGGEVTATLDPALVRKFAELGITATLNPPAEARDAAIAFPATEGRIATRTLLGRVAVAGGFTLTRFTTSVEIGGLGLDTGRGRILCTQRDGTRPDILDVLDVEATATRSGTITLTASATLNKTSADALNSIFSTDRFQAGEPFGTLAARLSTR